VKRVFHIIICILAVLDLHASYFELHVPLTSKTEAAVSHPVSTGRFHTTVHALDANGNAYAPGQSATGAHYAPGGPRRVNGEDSQYDNPDPSPTPVGDTPWLIIAGLGFIYMMYRKKKTA